MPGLLRRLLTGSEAALPPLQETLLRTVDLAGSAVNLLDPHIAAVIEPDVTAIGPMDFKKLDAALEAGRTAARAALEANPSLGH
jgi:NTE family protein